MVGKRTEELIEIGLSLKDIEQLSNCDHASQRILCDWLDRRQAVIEQRSQRSHPAMLHQPVLAMALLHQEY